MKHGDSKMGFQEACGFKGKYANLRDTWDAKIEGGLLAANELLDRGSLHAFLQGSTQ